ncbi:UbiA family prenyltransferase [Halobellus sp. GM3]|uniref:UbiA family prenyltransferase n=1 Tax=Halobellus sp. GM3 TaxID=3458410 RepID=UPI00403D5598
MALPSGRTRGAAAGLLAHVRPTFMLPAVGMSAYGSLLSPYAAFEPSLAALHAGTVGAALFVAHLRDGHVDGHRRGEETPRLSAAAFRRSIAVGAATVLALSALLLAAAGLIAAISTLSLLALALLHAPYLDRNPVSVTVDYPLGIGLVLTGGHAAQTGALDASVIAVAAAFVGLLSGIKVGIDRLDASFDRSIGKRTVPVALGEAGAARVAIGIFAVTALAVVAVGVAGERGVLRLRPRFAVAAATAPLGCLLATALASPERAVPLQMGLTYGFAALLFVAACNDQSAGAIVVDAATRTF